MTRAEAGVPAPDIAPGLAASWIGPADAKSVADQTNLRRADLNLLVVFDVVAETRSVTVAAERLSLSQPAVSHGLRRLRELLDDPLFVRGRGGLNLTPRAAALAQPVREILEAVGRVLAVPTFDPAETTRRFRVGASEYALMTIVPALIRELGSTAPCAGLEVRQIDGDTLDDLENGSLDVAFWGPPPRLGPFRSAELFRERHVGVLDGRHPLAGKARRNAVTLEDYLAFPHAVVTLGIHRPSPVDTVLGRSGRERSVAVVTPSSLSSVAALRGTRLIGSIPSRLVEAGVTGGLVTFELPIDDHEYPYSLVWHPRTDDDPGSAWLRDLIGAVSGREDGRSTADPGHAGCRAREAPCHLDRPATRRTAVPALGEVHAGLGPVST